MMKYTDVAVTLRLTEPMLGTVSKNPEVYAAYIATKAPDPAKMEEEVQLESSREDIEKSGWTGFHSDEKGLFIYDYMILGFLKEAGNTLKEQLGVKNLRSKLDNFVFVTPRRIYLGKDKPDGVFERPLRFMTMQGPRVALSRSDYVDAGIELNLTIRVIDNKEVIPKLIRDILDYGQCKGLGQFRNGSYGRFEVVSFA